MMQVKFGDLGRHHAPIAAEVDAAVARVLASGWYILGPEVRAFEQAFAAYCGVRHCIGTGNGTDALQLAMVALGVGAGDEIITAANDSVYETIAALSIGARPVFVDIDPLTHTIDPSQIAQAITLRTRLIVPVHLYGRVAEMTPIMELAEAHGIPVLEDACQAHGARYRGRRAGGIGAAGCFSFYPTKNLGAYGDGGAVTTDDDALAATLRELRQYGWEKKYVTARLGGMNSRLDELQAAVLHTKLAHLDGWTDRRRAIAARYAELLGDLPGITLPAEQDDGEPAYHLYVVRSTQRDALRASLAARGVGSEIHYPNVTYQQPVYAHLAPPAPLPHTEQICGEILSLPMYPELTDEEVTYVAEAVRASVND